MKSFKNKPLGKKYPNAAAWRDTTEESLQRHIMKAHLRPDLMKMMGVPLFDIELAQARDFTLNPVIAEAMIHLALPDDNEQYLRPSRVNPYQHRLAVVKTIRLIDEHNLADVSWAAVAGLYPGAADVRVDPIQDCHDYSFSALLADGRV